MISVGDFRKLRFICFLLLISLEVACSEIEPYPFEKRYVAEYQNGVCPNIEGKYYEIGEGRFNSSCIASGDPNDNSCSFSRLLFDHRLETNTTAFLRINQSVKDKILITFENAAGILHQVKLDKNNGEFFCTKEGLEIPQLHFIADGTGTAGVTENFVLNSLNGNYLLVKRVSHIAALGFYFVPLAGVSESWFKWTKVNTENP